MIFFKNYLKKVANKWIKANKTHCVLSKPIWISPRLIFNELRLNNKSLYIYIAGLYANPRNFSMVCACPIFFKSRRWAHTPEKGTWLWTLQICTKKTWCPSQWYVPSFSWHLSWDSPQMSENPHPALRHINRYLKNTKTYCPVYILFCSGDLWSIFQIFHKMQVAQIKQLIWQIPQVKK